MDTQQTLYELGLAREKEGGFHVTPSPGSIVYIHEDGWCVHAVFGSDFAGVIIYDPEWDWWMASGAELFSSDPGPDVMTGQVVHSLNTARRLAAGERGGDLPETYVLAQLKDRVLADVSEAGDSGERFARIVYAMNQTVKRFDPFEVALESMGDLYEPIANGRKA